MGVSHDECLHYKVEQDLELRRGIWIMHNGVSIIGQRKVVMLITLIGAGNFTQGRS